MRFILMSGRFGRIKNNLCLLPTLEKLLIGNLSPSPTLLGPGMLLFRVDGSGRFHSARLLRDSHIALTRSATSEMKSGESGSEYRLGGMSRLRVGTAVHGMVVDVLCPPEEERGNSEGNGREGEEEKTVVFSEQPVVCVLSLTVVHNDNEGQKVLAHSLSNTKLSHFQSPITRYPINSAHYYCYSGL
jgi:hypothetical protein